ncbi:hypothetical protein DLAC_08672 [Tieghemostelium lacteum]|uniref:Uncharacterized protein n=1 Tax=Tieghemostelium lacteum TaxID=361077 RepID=A0A151Z816_TIELA|nr:hypothetical protein DLAC_08672 [Tieghemostelium lacteum]|eukprot:KYQ90087.1 hypothetical protein DLAC_08672 [Tieghemostelium lacteum]
MVGAIFAQENPTCTFFTTTAAALDPTYGPATGGNAFSFNGEEVKGAPVTLANEYNFVNNAGLTTIRGNLLIVSGTMVPVGQSGYFFDVRMTFTRADRVAEPKHELQPAAYTTGGIDDRTWIFYTLNNGTFTGGDAMAGYNFQLSEMMDMKLQFGFGANGKNLNQGLSGWFSFTFNGPNGLIFTSTKYVDINVDTSCIDCPTDSYTVQTAVADANLGGQSGGQALNIQSSDLSQFGGNARWNFVDNAGLMTINQDGTAVITGTLLPVDSTNTSNTMTCTFFLLPSAANDPKRELSSSAYYSAGAIQTSLFTFYDVSTTGSSFCTYNGNNITINSAMNNFQMGVGANGKNGNFGASAWMGYTNQAAGSILDINVDLICFVTRKNNSQTPCPFMNTTSITSITTTTQNYSIPSTSTITSIPTTTTTFNNTSPPSTSTSTTSTSSTTFRNTTSTSTSTGATPTTAPPCVVVPANCRVVCDQTPAPTTTPVAGNPADMLSISTLLVGLVTLLALVFIR